MTSPRFRFGLERVRELRAHDEDQAKEAFASSVQERVRGAAQLAAAEGRLTEAHEVHRGLGSALDAQPSGADLISMQLWLERVEQSRREAERELQRRDTDVIVRRSQLTEASQRRQALERLKERRAADHAAALARQEAVFLDEIALSQHVRRSAS
jgi:flagellar FliJ protein